MHENDTVAADAGGGVWATSTPAFWKSSYVIFALDDVTPQGERYFEAFAQEAGIGYKRLLGSYKGVQETAWIVNAKAFELLPRRFTQKQESLLLLAAPVRDPRAGKLVATRSCTVRPATLVFADGSKVDLGHFRETPAAEALKRDAWTFDPSQRAYFVAD